MYSIFTSKEAKVKVCQEIIAPTLVGRSMLLGVLNRTANNITAQVTKDLNTVNRQYTIYMTAIMTSTQVVETSVNVTINSPYQDYSHPVDQTTQTTETPGFKPFTVLKVSFATYCNFRSFQLIQFIIYQNPRTSVNWFGNIGQNLIKLVHNINPMLKFTLQ